MFEDNSKLIRQTSIELLRVISMTIIVLENSVIYGL